MNSINSRFSFNSRKPLTSKKVEVDKKEEGGEKVSDKNQKKDEPIQTPTKSKKFDMAKYSLINRYLAEQAFPSIVKPAGVIEPENKTPDDIKNILNYFNKKEERYINLGYAMLINLDIPYNETTDQRGNHTIKFSYNNQNYEISYSDIEISYRNFSDMPKEDMPEEIVNDIMTLLESNDGKSVHKAMKMIRALGVNFTIDNDVVTFTYNGKEYRANVPSYLLFNE